MHRHTAAGAGIDARPFVSADSPPQKRIKDIKKLTRYKYYNQESEDIAGDGAWASACLFAPLFSRRRAYALRAHTVRIKAGSLSLLLADDDKLKAERSKKKSYEERAASAFR